MHAVVAKTVVDELKRAPENGAINVTADEVYAILKQNPPYVQLCEQLEKKGLRFHRGQLARQLAARVPGISRLNNPGRASVALPSPSPAAAPASVMSAPAGGLLVNTANEYMRIDGGPATHHMTMIPLHTAYPSVSGKPENTKLVDRARENVPYAAPQYRLGPSEAREPVDLTQTSDDDDDGNNVPRDDHVQGRTFEKIQTVSNMQHQPLPPRLQNSYNSLPGGLPQEQKTILARPINKTAAVKKPSYDAKTVATDILIAMGRHPQQRPLNAHMGPLLDRYVNLDSDLSTFDWDAIDPGQPPIPKAAPVSIPAAQGIRKQCKPHARRSQGGNQGQSGRSGA